MEISSFFQAKKRKRNEEEDTDNEEPADEAERTEWRDVDTPAVESLREEFQYQSGFFGFAGFLGEYEVNTGKFLGNLKCKHEGCSAPKFL